MISPPAITFPRTRIGEVEISFSFGLRTHAVFDVVVDDEIQLLVREPIVLREHYINLRPL